MPGPAGASVLGSGRAVALGTGPKAGLLDRAAGAGLPVPVGIVIHDGAGADGLERWCHQAGVTRVAVRSAFSAEDGTASSRAGWYRTRLRVAPAGIAGAVAEIRDDPTARTEPGLRHDVLVMAMVEAHHAGVAFSEAGTYDDLVNLVGGTAEDLVGGRDGGERHLLPRLERVEAGWPRRLQRLLRRIRRQFGDAAWDVEWADDGQICWLIQLRAVTRPSRRNETLTIANHAEILPPLPSPLMTSVIARSGPQLFAWYRRFDPTLPAHRPFLEVVAGRPFINLSLLEDMLRHLGLPTGLVADSIGGPPEQLRPARPLRLLRKSPALIRMGWAQIAAVRAGPANEARLAALGQGRAPTFGAALDLLGQAHVGLVTGMFPLSSAIGAPLAALRRSGTLVEHASRHRSITTELALALDAARAAGPGSAARQAFLERFGHRGVYESDIARPRYRDQPELIGARACGPTADEAAGDGRMPPAPGPRTWRGRLTTPLWLAARPPLAARERLRDSAMIGFAQIRDTLVALAGEAVADGRLPSVDHLWLLDVEEAHRLDDGWTPEPGFWAERAAHVAGMAALDPPPVVRRFDDPATWSHSIPGDRTLLRGLSLTDGTVRGRAWVLREPSLAPPAGFRPADTVLVARSVDAGWIPTFALAAGVVVETGGDLSHGSILLRELGLPAITNTAGATRALVDGDEVELRAGAGVVERL